MQVPSVTRRSSSTRGARRARTVATLLVVVEDLLAEGEQFSELTVERLVTAAGMSRSTFYVYFEDKGTLLLALAQDVVERMLEAADAWWNLPLDADRSDVEDALGGIVEVYLRHDDLWGALIEASAYDPRVRASFRAVVDSAGDALARHIRDGQQRGSVRPGLDPQRTAGWLTWMTERGHHQLVAGASPDEVRAQTSAQAAIVWHTLYEGAPSREEHRAA